MKKYTILTTDGSTGISRLAHKPKYGQIVSLEIQDENGNPLQVKGCVADVLDEQDY